MAAKTVLENALLAGDSLLIHGPNPALADLTKAIRAAVDTGEPIDLRDPAAQPDERNLRKLLAERLAGKGKTALVLTGAHPSDALRAIVSEISEGRLFVAPGDARKLPAGSRVVAIVPTASPDAPFASVFALRVSAERALSPLASR